MEDLSISLQSLGQAILYSFFLFLFGRLFYSINSMRGLAKKTWQKALTELITALVGIIGIGAVMVIWVGI